MPLDEDDLKNRGHFRPGVLRKEDEIDFTDLIYGTAESIAHAQAALDYELAETVAHFAETNVDVVPRVVRTIETDGTVTNEPQEKEKRSLLDLGLTPTRYQFSEVTVDVEFDLSFAIDETDTRDEKRKARFRVDTSEAHHRRRYHGEANTTAKISARLVPVPTPAALLPATVEPTPGPTTGTGDDPATSGDTGTGEGTNETNGADETNETDETNEANETNETPDESVDER